MKPKVLVVDDEQDIRELLKFYLNKEGYEVLEAGDGEEALNIFENEYVDLGIIDVMMPQIDGIEMCRRIRTCRNIPIIILSAKSADVDKGLADAAGAAASSSEVMAKFSNNLFMMLKRKY